MILAAQNGQVRFLAWIQNEELGGGDGFWLTFRLFPVGVVSPWLNPFPNFPAFQQLQKKIGNGIHGHHTAFHPGV
jgi:hypothetical protein